MFKNSIKASAIALGALSLGIAGAASAATINFDQEAANSPTGTVSYDGNGGALTGSHISFSYINLTSGDNGGNNQLVCPNRCYLNFTTGNNITEGSQTAGSIYQFAGGGSFQLTGEVASTDGSFMTGGTNQAILTGMFTDTPTVVSGGKTTMSFFGNGDNTVSADILQYFGIDPDTQFMFANDEISFQSTKYQTNGGFKGSVTAADLNAQSPQDVPEPQEFAIFGLGLVLLVGGLAFRRRNGGGDLIA